jgi:NADPH:quinone reductase-like Zn-dependent oxidoreductase
MTLILIKTHFTLSHIYTLVSPIQQGARVLVTGATGYVGASVADQFIQAGYAVVGTSRTRQR